MVRRIRFPEGMRNHFTPNQMYGWPDGIQYSPATRKETKRKQRQLRALQAKADALVIEAMLLHFVPERATQGIELL